jgi:ribose-phosphate pyrophosphokinase
VERIRVFTGNANIELAMNIVACLGLKLGQATVGRFSDYETRVEIGENVRGRDVFIVQPTSSPANEHLMELIIMADALRRASARRITAVMPYYGYARQDRKVKPRVPITAKVVAEMLMVVGIRRVLTMDLHAGQIQGFFNCPVDNLYAKPVFINYIHEMFGKDIVMVSPDAGGAERTRSYAKNLGADLAIIDKRRERENECEVMHVIGNVSGKIAIMVDDMVDTAGTLCNGARALMNKGAKEVHACCSHPVLSGSAVEKIEKSEIKTMVVTDSIPLSGEAKKSQKIRTVSVADMFAQAIKRTNEEDSISELFDIPLKIC